MTLPIYDHLCAYVSHNDQNQTVPIINCKYNNAT